MNSTEEKLVYAGARTILSQSRGWFEQTLQEMGRNYFIRGETLPSVRDCHIWANFLEDLAFPLNGALVRTLALAQENFTIHEAQLFAELKCYHESFVEAHRMWRLGHNPDYRLVSPAGNFPRGIESWVNRHLEWSYDETC